jgi:hypothetical protein
MISIADLIGKGNSKVTVTTDSEYMDLAMQITAEWENIVNSPMVLRDEKGNKIYLRKDERVIEGVDF